MLFWWKSELKDVSFLRTNRTIWFCTNSSILLLHCLNCDWSWRWTIMPENTTKLYKKNVFYDSALLVHSITSFPYCCFMIKTCNLELCLLWYLFPGLSKRDKDALASELHEVVKTFRESFMARIKTLKRKHKKQLQLVKPLDEVITTRLWTISLSVFWREVLLLENSCMITPRASDSRYLIERFSANCLRVYAL